MPKVQMYWSLMLVLNHVSHWELLTTVKLNFDADMLRPYY